MEMTQLQKKKALITKVRIITEGCIKCNVCINRTEKKGEAATKVTVSEKHNCRKKILKTNVKMRN